MSIQFSLFQFHLSLFFLSGFAVEVLAQDNFEFDKQNLKKINGVSRAEGGGTVKLKGVSSFLENVVGMGLFGSQQAVGVQMAINMFVLPVGDDMKQIQIVIQIFGGIFANGLKPR